MSSIRKQIVIEWDIEDTETLHAECLPIVLTFDDIPRELTQSYDANATQDVEDEWLNRVADWLSQEYDYCVMSVEVQDAITY